MRTARYRLTHYAEASAQGDLRHLPHAGPVELFDLELDPGENENVAAGHPEVMEDLMALLRHGWRAVRPGDADR